jgi:hypothetical protein
MKQKRNKYSQATMLKQLETVDIQYTQFHFTCPVPLLPQFRNTCILSPHELNTHCPLNSNSARLIGLRHH